MRVASGAQKAKIHVLAMERGMDRDMLHDFVYQLTKKESIKALSIMEAVKVIDALEGKRERAVDAKTEHLSAAQLKYIRDLAKVLGWMDEKGSKRLDAFCKAQYGKGSHTWLSKSQGCKLITALKIMVARLERA